MRLVIQETYKQRKLFERSRLIDLSKFKRTCRRQRYIKKPERVVSHYLINVFEH
jgi:hypothetical protein